MTYLLPYQPRKLSGVSITHQTIAPTIATANTIKTIIPMILKFIFLPFIYYSPTAFPNIKGRLTLIAPTLSSVQFLFLPPMQSKTSLSTFPLLIFPVWFPPTYIIE